MDTRVAFVRQFIWERCVGPLRPASRAAKSLGCKCADEYGGNKNDGHDEKSQPKSIAFHTVINPLIAVLTMRIPAEIHPVTTPHALEMPLTNPVERFAIHCNSPVKIASDDVNNVRIESATRPT